MEVRNASTQQAQALVAQAKQLETYVGSAQATIASRYAWWETVRNFAGSYDVDLADILGAELVDLNAKCDAQARDFATAVHALNNGTAELVGREDGQALTLSVVAKGALPKPMGVWPFVPLILVGAGIIAGVVMLDAWLEMRQAEADAQKAQAANVAKWAELAQKAQAMGPDAMKQLQRVIDAANQASSKPAGGILAKLARPITAVTDAVGEAAEETGGWLVLAAIAAFLISRSKGKAKGGLFG